MRFPLSFELRVGDGQSRIKIPEQIGLMPLLEMRPVNRPKVGLGGEADIFPDRDGRFTEYRP